MHKVFDFVAQNWAIIVPVIYEVGARVTPTKKNLSIIDLVVKILGVIVKNRRKPSIDDETPDGPQNVNIVEVDRNKHIIS